MAGDGSKDVFSPAYGRVRTSESDDKSCDVVQATAVDGNYPPCSIVNVIKTLASYTAYFGRVSISLDTIFPEITAGSLWTLTFMKISLHCHNNMVGICFDTC